MEELLAGGRKKPHVHQPAVAISKRGRGLDFQDTERLSRSRRPSPWYYPEVLAHPTRTSTQERRRKKQIILGGWVIVGVAA